MFYKNAFFCCYCSSSSERGKSSILHCADIDVVSCEDLKNTLREYFQKVYKVKVYQHLFCGQSHGKDVCYVGLHGLLYMPSCKWYQKKGNILINCLSFSQGDSGGGVVHRNMIYGVISFLGDPHNVCRKAAAFMDICSPEYNMWIRQTVA